MENETSVCHWISTFLRVNQQQWRETQANVLLVETSYKDTLMQSVQSTSVRYHIPHNT